MVTNQNVSKKVKNLLVSHIKDLDYHSSRESDKKQILKWNTPVMNEFIAFGKLCYYMGKIVTLKKNINVQLMVLTKNDINEDELDHASLLDVCSWIVNLLKDESFFPKDSAHIELKRVCERFVNTHYQPIRRGKNG